MAMEDCEWRGEFFVMRTYAEGRGWTGAIDWREDGEKGRWALDRVASIARDASETEGYSREVLDAKINVWFAEREVEHADRRALRAEWKSRAAQWRAEQAHSIRAW